MNLSNVDYGKIEKHILDSMKPTEKALFEAARAAVNAAPTREARNLAKRDFFALLYGNPQPIKKAITLPTKD